MSRGVARRWTSTLIIAVGLSACRSRMTDEEIVKLVDQRLAERGLVGSTPEAATSDAGPNATTGLPDDPASRSFAFLDRAESVMAGFRPAMPVIEDKSDIFRCVTSFRATADADIKKAISGAKADREKARAEAERARRDFEQRVLPLAFRVDYDWRTRKTSPTAAVYGCYNVTYHKWTTVPDEAQCNENPYSGVADFSWRPRVEARPALFLYSNSETPPEKPPELMQRLEQAGVTIPSRFACRVLDVVVEHDRRVIKCQTPPGAPSVVIRVAGELRDVNIGDLASAPLADAHRDPDGVLFVARAELPARSDGGRRRGHRPPETAVPEAHSRWVVDADGPTVTVDAAATCPALAEMLASIPDGGGR